MWCSITARAVDTSSRPASPWEESVGASSHKERHVIFCTHKLICIGERFLGRAGVTVATRSRHKTDCILGRRRQLLSPASTRWFSVSIRGTKRRRHLDNHLALLFKVARRVRLPESERVAFPSGRDPELSGRGNLEENSGQEKSKPEVLILELKVFLKRSRVR